MSPKISIIILNWNGWKDTIECLESVYQINYPNYDVIVVDNNSKDESISKIKEYCNNQLKIESNFFKYNSNNKPIGLFEYTKKESETIKKNEINFPKSKHLIIIKNDENYGFAEGNNIGIRFALKLDSDYVLLLNNDTVVDKSFLSELARVTGDKVGIIGSKIYFYDNPNLIQSAGVKINWFLGEMISIEHKQKDNENSNIKKVESVSGCSMLISKNLITKIGLIDTSYFLYYEDTDFCLRTRKADYQILFTPHSKVWHKTSATSRKKIGLREFYSARNLFKLMKNYANKKQYYFFLLYFFCFKIWFTSVVILVFHKEFSALVPFLRGSYNGFKLVVEK